MPLIALALSALIVQSCNWPPQDTIGIAEPTFTPESLPVLAAQTWAEALIAKANGSEVHLDGTVVYFKQGPPTGPRGMTGYLGAEEFGLANLASLPPSIANLEWLRTLTLSYTAISDLSPIAGLKHIETLDLSTTRVSDLSPLAALENLETLNLSDTPVTDISPLAGLTHLKELDLSGTGITDLAPLAGLVRLQSLKLSGQGITDLSPLAKV
ncbi:MAG: leucine-rich repeat domain-containing protein, partial [Rhodobacteraceae bacterium]|nr:leucine-rich repeat domain-containing protein [Paracoccaceae bacterium]